MNRYVAEPGRRCRGDAGFTLMELIVVCVLIGLLLSVAIPSLRNAILSRPLDTAARKLIGAVTEARQTAIREHAPYILSFDFEKNRYWYEKEGTIYPLGDEPDTLVTLPTGVSFKDILSSRNESQSSGQVDLWISSKGCMDQIVVRLRDTDDDQLGLFFYPFIVASRLVEGDGGLE